MPSTQTAPEYLIRQLKAVLPEVDDILGDITASDGWYAFPVKVIDACIKHNLRWWEFYEEEGKIRALVLLMIYGPDEIRELAERNGINKIEVANEIFEVGLALDFNLPTPEEQNALMGELATLPEDQQKEILKRGFIFLLGTLTSLSNYLALMTQGRTMCRLVADAKAGDDDAFCRAVQIDRTVLNLPFFRERLIRAQLGKDPGFLDKLAYRIKNPVLAGKIRYRKLWLTFAILEEQGFLDLPHDQLLDLCEEVGVYGKAFGVEDVGHLRKRLREYRETQRNSKIF